MMVQTHIDPELVRSAQQGEPEAVERLLKQCGPMLLRTCTRYARPGVDPDDAFQDALEHIIKGLPTLDNPGSFAAWSCLIARRRAIKPRFVTWLLRKVSGHDPDQFPGHMDPECSASHRQRAAVLRRGLATLDPKERIAVEGTHLEGLSCREVAEAQGWNHATTRRRKQRGEARLRDLLGGELRDESSGGDAPHDEDERSEVRP